MPFCRVRLSRHLKLEYMQTRKSSNTNLNTGQKKPKKTIPSRVSLGAVVRENLPLPIVYYPNHYGTFFGFAPNEESPTVICACAKPAIQNLYHLVLNPDHQEEHRYVYDLYFPKVIENKLRKWDGQFPFPIEFTPGICHRCNLVAPTLRYCHEMYGTRFIQFYGWYVNQTYLRLGMLPGGGKYLPDVCPPEYQSEIDEALKIEEKYRQETERLMAIASGPKRDDISDDEVTYWRNVREEDAALMVDLRRMAAMTRRSFTTKIENIVRQEFGFRKVGEGWVSETLLYQIVRRICSNHEVLFHYRPDWLKGLEIDVYVPALKTGFEYQGAQHFHPIKAWGGEEALERVRQRDAQKSLLCRELGVRLITVDYTEALTEDYIRALLSTKQADA